jgi:hypothetical protein
MASRKMRNAGILAGILILLFVTTAFAERMRGTHELNAVLTQLREARVELDPAKLKSTAVPESDNAATALLLITNELQSFSLPADVGAIPLMKLSAAGEAQSFLRSGSWPGSKDRLFRWEQLEDTRCGSIGVV